MKAPPQYNTTVMAKESITNYSVSKETALLLDAVKSLEKAWDSVYDSLSIKHDTDDHEKIREYMTEFDEAFDKAKEFVFDTIHDNVLSHTTIQDFKSI